MKKNNSNPNGKRRQAFLSYFFQKLTILLTAGYSKCRNLNDFFCLPFQNLQTIGKFPQKKSPIYLGMIKNTLTLAVEFGYVKKGVFFYDLKSYLTNADSNFPACMSYI